MPMGKAHRSKAVLDEMYNGRGLSLREIASELDVHDETVRKWMDKHGIERRDRVEGIVKSRSKSAVPFVTSRTDGYNTWSHTYRGQMDTVFTHRLLAVAKYGFTDVCENEVHHKNGVKWDNRPENLTLMSAANHRKHHHETGELGAVDELEKVTNEMCREMRQEYATATQRELAAKYGVSCATVNRHVNERCHHE